MIVVFGTIDMRRQQAVAEVDAIGAGAALCDARAAARRSDSLP